MTEKHNHKDHVLTFRDPGFFSTNTLRKKIQQLKQKLDVLQKPEPSARERNDEIVNSQEFSDSNHLFHPSKKLHYRSSSQVLRDNSKHQVYPFLPLEGRDIFALKRIPKKNTHTIIQSKTKLNSQEDSRIPMHHKINSDSDNLTLFRNTSRHSLLAENSHRDSNFKRMRLNSSQIGDLNTNSSSHTEFLFKKIFEKNIFDVLNSKKRGRKYIDNKLNLHHMENIEEFEQKMRSKDQQHLSISKTSYHCGYNKHNYIHEKLSEIKAKLCFMKGVFDYSFPAIIMKKYKIHKKLLMEAKKKREQRGKNSNDYKSLDRELKENQNMKKNYLNETLVISKITSQQEAGIKQGQEQKACTSSFFTKQGGKEKLTLSQSCPDIFNNRGVIKYVAKSGV